MKSRSFAAAAAAVLSLALACGDDGTDPMADSGDSGSDTEQAPFDEAEVIAQGGMFASALVQINAMPFPSEHGLADMVNVYTDAGAADMFRGLDPESPSEVALPEGTLLVKEHLDAQGAYAGYLMMYRGPDGYAPETDNWFWARVDAAGTPQDTGPSGDTDYCIGCHMRAPSLVFGVAPDNQM